MLQRHEVPSYVNHKAVHGAVPSVVASFRLMQLSFSHPAYLHIAIANASAPTLK